MVGSKLHPKVHAPILFDRDDTGSIKELRKMGSKAIDLVVINLYPFAFFGRNLFKKRSKISSTRQRV